MSLAVILKTARDRRLVIGLVLAGIVLLEALFVFVAGDFRDEIEFLSLRKAFFQRFARALLGADLGGQFTATALVSIGMVHPLLLAMTWTLLLTACTAVIAGEIDRGTADVLLALPLSRQRLYASMAVPWAGAGFAVAGAMLLGVRTGEALAPLWEPVHFDVLVKLACNYLAMYWCIGAAATCVSSFCSRPGTAIGIVLAWLLGSFLMNFLATFWTLPQYLGRLGPMAYYRPLPIIRDGRWPLTDMAVLIGAGVTLWLIGLWHFRRRDIPA
jgi:ABC-2 type transport system permease protein